MTVTFDEAVAAITAPGGSFSMHEEVIERLEELVVKPVDGSGGKGVLIGPAASGKSVLLSARSIIWASA